MEKKGFALPFFSFSKDRKGSGLHPSSGTLETAYVYENVSFRESFRTMAAVRLLISSVSRMFYLRKDAHRKKERRRGKIGVPCRTRDTGARYGENGEQIRGDRHETYLKMFYLKGEKKPQRSHAMREEHLRNESRPGIIRPPSSSSYDWRVGDERAETASGVT